MSKIKKLFKHKKILMIGVCSLFAVVIIISSSYLYIKHKYNKDILVDKLKTENSNTVKPEANSEPKQVEVNYGVESEIVNVLLVGVDTRGEFNDSRTDSIIIASIDPTTKKVKLTSLMRDMYVEIPGKGYNKINAAFEMGNMELLKKTIAYNFGLTVDNYIAVDFQGFQDLIDTLEGVELDIKGYEVNETNKYIKEFNGNNSKLIETSGMQKLNGQQALAYCRIRKVGNNDYERTERQRRVLSLLLAKIKDTSVLNYPKLYSTISNYVKTNIPFESMVKIVYTVFKFGDAAAENFRIPIDGYFKDTSMDGQSVLIPELKYNAVQFYKFIYNFVPSNLKVPDNSSVYNKETEIKKTENTDENSKESINNGNTQNQTPTQAERQPNTQTNTQVPQQFINQAVSPSNNSQQTANPVVLPSNSDAVNNTTP